jgi:hypothetical protein
VLQRCMAATPSYGHHHHQITKLSHSINAIRHVTDSALHVLSMACQACADVADTVRKDSFLSLSWHTGLYILAYMPQTCDKSWTVGTPHVNLVSLISVVNFTLQESKSCVCCNCSTPCPMQVAAPRLCSVEAASAMPTCH